MPASGNYAFVPGLQQTTTLTTTKILYGLDLGTIDQGNGLPGASAVVVSALDASGNVLDTVSAELTGPKMSFLDTSRFAGLTRIAGYRLVGTPDANGNYDYAADDFTFSSAAVPEASTTLSFGHMFALGVGALLAARCRKAWTR